MVEGAILGNGSTAILEVEKSYFLFKKMMHRRIQMYHHLLVCILSLEP